jgi:uncharacterized protein YqeY
VDQLESLCEIEENEAENKPEEMSDEDDIEHSSDNEQQRNVSTEGGNHVEENLDELEEKGEIEIIEKYCPTLDAFGQRRE